MGIMLSIKLLNWPECKVFLQGRLKPVKGVYDSHGGHGTVKIVRELLENKIGYDKKFLHYYEGWFRKHCPPP